MEKLSNAVDALNDIRYLLYKDNKVSPETYKKVDTQVSYIQNVLELFQKRYSYAHSLPEVHNIKDFDLNTMLAFVFLESLVENYGEESINNQLKAAGYDGTITLELLANGVPLNVSCAFAEIENQLERMIKDKAVELINEKFTDIEDKLVGFNNQIADMRRDFSRKVCQELGIEYKDEEY